MQEASEATAAIVKENWLRVTDDVASACQAASRPPDSVRIVGVSKYVGPELTAQLVSAGCRTLGENRPQSIWQKQEWFDNRRIPDGSGAQSDSESLDFQWHMIGHFQRNKVRRTLPMVGCLHSLDSLRLAQTIQDELQKSQGHGATPQSVEVQQAIASKSPAEPRSELAGVPRLATLVEVNITEDATKTGLPASELFGLLEQAASFECLAIQGLMAMSTHFAGGEQARREFAQVRALFEQACQRFPSLGLTELSMGMSGDYREAIAEGATMVRIGSSLWEGIR